MPYKDRAQKNEYERLRKRRLRLAAIAVLGGACADCGETNVAELEFDHVRGVKVMNVTRLISLKPETLCAELAKCELRCLACHAVKDGRLERDRWGDFKRSGVTSCAGSVVVE